MSARASCPVFRCQKTSISQCTGYRRASCERYYCQTHTKGTLCDRCVSIKQEDMKAGYRQMLKSIERKSYSASRTLSVVTLFLISILLLAVAIICTFLQKNNQSILPIFVISLGGGVLGLFGSLIWYWMKSREYMRAESVELDLSHPGFYDYYRQWQAKLDDITSNYN